MDNVLLISPDFFYYQDIIKKGFHDLNYDCEWYSDRPGTDFITKSLIRFSPKLMKNKSKRYLNNILLNTTNKKYKFIVVIMGEVLTEDFITQLKKAHSESKSIYVFWDTIANFSYGVKLAHLFDKVFTTDRIDAINYNFNFIPLFYNPYIDTSKKSIVYDYCFIGTIKHGKNKSINEIVTFLNVKFEKSFVYKYLQGKLVFLYYKIKYMNEFKEERINNYKYKKISLEKTINIFKQSKYIIDVPMNQQNAVTERCFNALFLEKKVITTNKDIVNYDFYSKNNIYIYIPGEEIDFSSSFFQTKFTKIDNFDCYSLHSWLKKIIDSCN